ncbi:DUF4340 domain-containing protein [Lachnospiraceae bacterium ZAX-1]
MKISIRYIVMASIFTLVIIVGGLLLTGQKKEQAGEEVAITERSERFYPVEVHVANDTGTYELQRTGDGGTSIPKLSKVPINKGLADSLFYDMQGIKSVGIVQENKENLEDFGLANPKAEISLCSEDGQELVLYLGNKSPVVYGYYLSTNRPDEGVYLVDAYYGDAMLRSLESYRNLQLIDFVYESDFDGLSSFLIKGKSRLPLEFKNSADGFMMTQPVEYRCVPNELLVNILEPLVHLKAEEYLGQVDQEGTGLKDPEYVIGINYRGEDIKVLIGDEIGDKRYLAIDGEDALFTVATKNLNFLKLDYRQAIGSSLYFRSIAVAKKVVVVDQGKAYEFDIMPGDQEYPAKYGEKEISSLDFVTLYNRIIAMPLVNKLGEETLGEPEIVITVTLAQGQEDIVTLTKINEREYAVDVNGKCEFSTLAAAVDFIREKLVTL